MQTVKGGLENLIKTIRRNILQTPKSTWAEKIQKTQSNTPSTKEPVSKAKKDVPKVDENKRKFARKDFIAKNKEALANVKKLEYEEDHMPDVPPSTSRKSRSPSVDEERLLNSTSFHVIDFKPNKKKGTLSNQDSFIVSNAFEEVPLNPGLLAEIIKYTNILPISLSCVIVVVVVAGEKWNQPTKKI